MGTRPGLYKEVKGATQSDAPAVRLPMRTSRKLKAKFDTQAKYLKEMFNYKFLNGALLTWSQTHLDTIMDLCIFYNASLDLPKKTFSLTKKGCD